MSIKVIKPPFYLEESKDYDDRRWMIFLAGPIQGAPDWQKEAITLFDKYGWNDHVVASPRRDEDSWQGDYEGQVEWEHHYLNRAAYKGTIMFWCPKEAVHDCNRDYSQTTRQEMGKWFELSSESGYAPVVVGLGEGFPGAKYITHDLTNHYSHILPIYSTLEDTVKGTIDKISYLPSSLYHTGN